jgi:Putative RNA methyltransferase
MEALDSSSRKDRKKEGRNLKRQRIEAAGGIRPRQRRDVGQPAKRHANEDTMPIGQHSKGSTPPTAEKGSNQSTKAEAAPSSRGMVGQGQRASSTAAGAPGEGRSKSAPPRPAVGKGSAHPHPRRDRQNHHRFGRVMDQPPCPNQPRTSTLSIAIPGSVVANCQTRELKTTLVGQIARAATIYHGTKHSSLFTTHAEHIHANSFRT